MPFDAKDFQNKRGGDEPTRRMTGLFRIGRVLKGFIVHVAAPLILRLLAEAVVKWSFSSLLRRA